MLSGSAVAFVWLILATLPTRARNRRRSTACLGAVELGEKHEQAVREALERFPRDFPDDPRQEQIKALGYATAKRVRGRSPTAQLRAVAPVTSEAALEGVPALPESANTARARLYSHCRVGVAGVWSSFARGPPLPSTWSGSGPPNCLSGVLGRGRNYGEVVLLIVATLLLVAYARSQP